MPTPDPSKATGTEVPEEAPPGEPTKTPTPTETPTEDEAEAAARASVMFASTPGTSAIRNDNTLFAYVGAGENIDISFTQVRDSGAIATTTTIFVRGPGGVSLTCTRQPADPVGSACSWTDLSAASAGVWQIDFAVSGGSADYYDWTINVQSGTTTIPGRVYSEKYTMAQRPEDTSNLSLWYQSEQGFRYRADYVAYNGVDSIFTSDATGVARLNTCVSAYESMDRLGDFSDADRLWVPPTDECGDPYKIFFEAPAASLPASAPLWNGVTTEWLRPPVVLPALSDLAFTRNSSTTSAGEFTFQATNFTGQLEILVDVNNDGDYTDPVDRSVPAAVTQDGEVTVAFDGFDGLGNPITSTQTIDARVSITKAGEIHFVNNDVEARGSLRVQAINGPDAGSTDLYWNDTTLRVADRICVTPVRDGRAGVDSSGGVHGWPCPIDATANANDGTSGSWGDVRNIDDWTFHTINEFEEIEISGIPLEPLSCTSDPLGYLFLTPGGDGPRPTDVAGVNLVTGKSSTVAADIATFLNGVGYNPVDDFMYAFSLSTPIDMVRIGEGFGVESIGLPTNWATFPTLPATLRDIGPGIGEITPDGHYFVGRPVGSGLEWAEIDLDPASATYRQVLAAGTAAVPAGTANLGVDWSYNVDDGDLYLFTRTNATTGTFSLTRFDTTTHVLTAAFNLGVLRHANGDLATAVGATYADSDGFIYGADNASGGIWRTDMSTGQTAFFAPGPPSPANDGARCYNAPVPVDFGDAPNSFGTTAATNGARHAVPGYDPDTNTAPLMLGSTIDIDTDGRPTPGALGDDADAVDDEDAVTGPIEFTVGAPTTVPVRVTNRTAEPATLAAWADLNGNGVYEASERQIVPVPANFDTAPINVSWGPPLPMCQNVRFRVFPGDVADPSPLGGAAAGEVEDHAVVTAPACTEDDIPRTVSGVAQAWTPTSRVQTTTLPASLAVNGPDGQGTQLYSAATPASVLTLDLATVVPEGYPVTLHLAQASAAWSGPVRVTSSADGTTFGNPVTFTPTAAAPTYQEFDYLSPTGGARFIRIVPVAVAGVHSAVRVDAVTYSFVYCECEEAVNLVQNGGFEEYTNCTTQSGTFGSWRVIENNVHIWGAECPSGWATPEGTRSIDLDGGGTGGIEQTLTGLTPGSRYNLSFYMAFNPAAGAQSSSMRVSIGDFGRTYTSASDANRGGFNLVHVEFTADSTSEVLRFESLTGSNDPALLNGGGTSGYGVVLDDIRVTPMNCEEVVADVDYGDAPAGYGTDLVGNGPRHRIPGYDPATNTAPLMIGSRIDPDDDGLPTAGALGDDNDAVADEDGFPSGLVLDSGITSTTVTVPVTNTTGGAATLYGWIDFDNDGRFEPSEFASVAVPNGATSAELSMTGFPALVDGTTLMVRLRLTSDSLADNPATPDVDERALGLAASGEVEDHRAQVATVVPISCVDPFVENFGTGTGHGSPLPPGQTTYTFASSGIVPDGSYALPSQIPGEFGSWWHAGGDHTPGDTDGRMMLVNANFNPGIFFQRTFTRLSPGANYDFSAWITNANSAGSPIEPNVQFRVIDPATGTVLAAVDTGNLPNQTSLIWERFALQFTATQSTVRLEIANNAPGGNGNDLALDDIAFSPVCEFGDAPVSYGTTIAGDGASHIATGPTLGTLRDTEPDGQPNVTATGDDTTGSDDEDGVAAPLAISRGATTTVTVSATNDSDDDVTLAGWIDLDGDGTFEDAERVTVTLPASSGTADYELLFPAATTAADTFARFRVFGQVVDDPSPTGTANAGEVEDYLVSVLQPALSLSKTSNATVDSRPGDVITYVISATNNGPGDYTEGNPARVVDDLSALLDDAAYNNDASADVGEDPSYAQPLLSWTGELPAGESVTITYTVTLRGGGDGAVRNVVFEQCDPADPSCDPAPPVCDPPVGGVDPATGKVCAEEEFDLPKLTIAKTASRIDLPAEGETITYTVTVTNVGPGDYTAAAPAVMTDDLADVVDDATVNAGSPTANVGTATFTTPTLSWTGVLAAGESAEIEYTLTYNGDGDQVLINNACIPVGEAQDPQDPCATTRTPGSGLDPDKVSNPVNGAAVEAGQQVTYTLRWSNTGPAPATVDTFDDLAEVLDDADLTGGPTADPGLTAVVNGDRIDVDGTVPVGGSLEVTYTVTVRAWPAQGNHVLRNALQCSLADGPDCAPERIEHPVRGLHVQKTSTRTPDTVIGDTVTYTVIATNIGESDYTATEPAVLRDNLAGVLDDGSYNGDADADRAGLITYNEPVVRWEGALAIGQTVELTYTVDLTGAGDHIVRNVAWGGPGPAPACDPPTVAGFDPDTGQPCDENEFGLPDIVDSKSVTPGAGSVVVAGDELTYTLTFSNFGTVAGAVAKDDVVTGVLDDAVLVAPPGITSSDPALTATLVGGRIEVRGNLGAGETVTVQYTVEVKPDAQRVADSGDDRLGNFLVEPGEEPPAECLPANADCTTNPIPRIVDAKAVAPEDGTAVVAGDQVRYTLTFTNEGTGAGQLARDDFVGGVLDDADLLSGPTASDPALTATRNGQRIEVRGTLQPDQTVTVEYVVQVKPDAQRVADGGDDSLGNFLVDPGEQPPAECLPTNVDCTTNPIPRIVDAKSVDPSRGTVMAAGDELTYTLTFTNEGTGAGQVSREDVVSGVLDDAELVAPPGIISSEPAVTATLAGGRISIIGTLQPGQTVTVEYTVRVKPDAQRVADGGDDSLGNFLVDPGEGPPAECLPSNTDCTVNPIQRIADAKSVDPAAGTVVMAGDELTYTLTFSNEGTIAGQVERDDFLGGVLDDAELTGGPTVTGPGTVTATVNGDRLEIRGGLGAGDTVTVQYVVQVKPDAQRVADGGDDSLGNFLVDPGEEPPAECLPTNLDCTVNPVPRIVDAKSVDPARGTVVMGGDELTYTLTFSNEGTGAGDVDRVDDLSGVLDDAVLLEGPTASDPALSASGVQNGRFTITGALAGGQTVRVTYTVRVRQPGEDGDKMLGNWLLDPGDQPPTGCDPSGAARSAGAVLDAMAAFEDMTCNPIGGLVAEKSVDPMDGATVSPGDELTYTLSFRNTGRGDVKVDHTDLMAGILDDATVVRGPDASRGLEASETAQGRIRVTGTLAAGQRGEVTYTVRVKPFTEQGDHQMDNFLGPTGGVLGQECEVGDPMCVENPVAAPDDGAAPDDDAAPDSDADSLTETGSGLPALAISMAAALILAGALLVRAVRRRPDEEAHD